MKKLIIILLAAALMCLLLSACAAAEHDEDLIEMQIVYEDNPAFFLKDMKLIWGTENYYVSHMSGAKRGKEIGYVNDEYGGWRI